MYKFIRPAKVGPVACALAVEKKKRLSQIPGDCFVTGRGGLLRVSDVRLDCIRFQCFFVLSFFFLSLFLPKQLTIATRESEFADGSWPFSAGSSSWSPCRSPSSFASKYVLYIVPVVSFFKKNVRGQMYTDVKIGRQSYIALFHRSRRRAKLLI